MSLRASRRLAWLVTGVAILSILAAVPFSYLNRAANLPADFALWPADIIYLIPPASFILVGGFIAARQPGNAYGWILLASGLGQGSLLGFWTSYGIYSFHIAAQPPPFAGLAFVLPGVGWMLWVSSMPMLMLLYPTGRLRSPRWKPVLWLLGVNFILVASIAWLTDTPYGWIAVHNPYALRGSGGKLLEALLIGVVVVTLLLLVISGISLILNARRSTGIERQQYKWFAYAVAILISELSIDLIWEPAQPWEAFKESIPLVLLPVAIGMAILRYRLFDIDVLIRRTLQYALLTGLLALVYFGGVTLIQNLLSGVSHQQSAISIVLSTLAIAALFNPLRRRLLDLIDRRFYRQKYDAERTLEDFGKTLRGEVDIDRLREHLVTAVQETVQPERVSLWIKGAK